MIRNCDREVTICFSKFYYNVNNVTSLHVSTVFMSQPPENMVEAKNHSKVCRADTFLPSGAQKRIVPQTRNNK